MSGDNVVQFANATDDASHISVEGILREVRKDLDAGMFEPTHCLVLFYADGKDGGRNTYSYRAQLTKPEEIAMLELFKTMKVLDWLGAE